jgi:hypothetical protein
MNVYRYYEQDLPPGYVDTPQVDHLDKLSPEKQKAEIAIRKGDKRGQSRAGAIFVFEKLDVAKALLIEARDQYLFEVSVDEKDVVHRADLRIYDEIVETLKKNEDPRSLIKEFWMGVERPSPRIELEVKKVIIVKKIR